MLYTLRLYRFQHSKSKYDFALGGMLMTYIIMTTINAVYLKIAQVSTFRIKKLNVVYICSTSANKWLEHKMKTVL